MTEENENKLFVWKAINDEIAFRRDKRWKIFSWSGTILIMIMGGIITLKTDPKRLALFSVEMKAAVIIGISVITFFSIAWIRQNLAIEKKAKENLKEIDEILVMKSLSLCSPRFGFWHALVLLCIGMCVAVFL